MPDSNLKKFIDPQTNNCKPLSIDGGLTGPGNGTGGIPFRDSADLFLRVLEPEPVKVDNLTSANHECGDEVVAYEMLQQQYASGIDLLSHLIGRIEPELIDGMMKLLIFLKKNNS